MTLAPHLPDAHLRHAERLYRDGLGSNYWLPAFAGYLRAIDRPLFAVPIIDTLAFPLRLATQVPLALLVFLLFLRHREAFLRRYGLPGAAAPALRALCAYALPAVLAAIVLLLSGNGIYLLLPLAASLVPVAAGSERWTLFFAVLAVLAAYAVSSALGHLPPPPPDAIADARAFLKFEDPGSLGVPSLPYLLHRDAFYWLSRHAAHAFSLSLFFFVAACGLAFILARHPVAFCRSCGSLLEPGENALPSAERCIICDHVAKRSIQVREAEIRRWREQLAVRRSRDSRWSMLLSLMAPGAGLMRAGRLLEGAVLLFGAAFFIFLAAVWHAWRDLLVIHHPLSMTPVVACGALAAFLYVISVIQTFFVTRHS